MAHRRIGTLSGTPASCRSRLAFRLTLAALITALTLAQLFWLGDRATLAQAVRDSRGDLLAMAAALLVLGYLCRGLRIAMVLGERPSASLLRVSVLHNLLSTLLPMRLGEAALPLLLRRERRAGIGLGVGVLVSLRLFDLLAIGVAGGLVLILLGARLAPELPWLGTAAVAIAVMIVCGMPWLAVAASRLSAGGLARWPRLARFVGQMLKTALDFAWPARLALLGLSSLAWVGVIGAFYLTAHAFGIAVRPAEAVLAVTAAALAFVLPINGIGSLGPVQLGFAGVLAAFGHAFAPALLAATPVQLLTLLVMCALALILSLPWGKGRDLPIARTMLC
jgi:uncharacterized membrane protein YbhN (UPF0104 family)